MKRLYVVAAAVLALSLGLAFADGFRGIPWGSSREYVKSHEPFLLKDSSLRELCYVGTVNIFQNTDVYYVFTDEGHLAAGAYVFGNNLFASANSVADERKDFNRIELYLRDKYGDPVASSSSSQLFIVPEWLAPLSTFSAYLLYPLFVSGAGDAWSDYVIGDGAISHKLFHDVVHGIGDLDVLTYVSKKYATELSENLEKQVDNAF